MSDAMFYYKYGLITSDGECEWWWNGRCVEWWWVECGNRVNHNCKHNQIACVDEKLKSIDKVGLRGVH